MAKLQWNDPKLLYIYTPDYKGFTTMSTVLLVFFWWTPNFPCFRRTWRGVSTPGPEEAQHAEARHHETHSE